MLLEWMQFITIGLFLNPARLLRRPKSIVSLTGLYFFSFLFALQAHIPYSTSANSNLVLSCSPLPQLLPLLDVP